MSDRNISVLLSGLAPGRPVLLTIMTFIPDDWMLGVSASLFSLPLVIAGLPRHGARSSDLVPVDGAAFVAWKVRMLRTALRLLRATAPGISVIVVDGLDTVVVNPPPALTASAHVRAPLLLSAECNSWPRCYAEEYTRRSADHAQCRGACYANSGVFMGRSGALLRLLDAMDDEHQATRRNASASRNDQVDQAILHRLYLRLSPHAAAMPRAHLDHHQHLALNLWACRGPSAAELRRRAGHWPTKDQQCHDGDWDPLAKMHATADGGIAVRSGGIDARPVIVHSNGDHSRMHWSPTLGSLLRQLVRPREPLLSHPLLLVHDGGSSEEAGGGGANGSAALTSLGGVLGWGVTDGATASVNADPTRAAATQWLASAHHGYCRATVTGANDCTRGAHGAWILDPSLSRTWKTAVAACIELCNGCERCRVLSISLWEQDCSWFHNCHDAQRADRGTTPMPAVADPAQLRIDHPGFLSAPVRKRSSAEPGEAVAPMPAGDRCNRTRSQRAVATSWLAASREGHCGTTPNSQGDCERGDKGSWPLSSLIGSGGRSWRSAVQACLRRCSRCARCRHVSISLEYSDCGWYAACEATHTIPLSFRSGSLAMWTSARCNSSPPPPPRLRMAHPIFWLQSSVEGHCGITDVAFGGADVASCTQDSMGSWALSSLGLDVRKVTLGGASTNELWRDAASLCIRQCKSCQNCRHLSLSLVHDDCSWYATCTSIATTPRHFRSGRAEVVPEIVGATPFVSHARQQAEEDGKWRVPYADVLITPNMAASDLDTLAGRGTRSYAARRKESMPPPPTAAAAATMATRAAASKNDSSANASLVLLAIFSGSALRRQVVRCTWAAELSAHSANAVRLRFVVGVGNESMSSAHGGAAARGMPYGAHEVGDELRLRITEGQPATRNDPHNPKRPKRSRRTSGGGLQETRQEPVLHGSITKQLKLVGLLRWFVHASPPEHLLGMADDDVFISVHSLVAHARLLASAMRDDPAWRHVYAGRLEWYSWHTRTLIASGWSEGSLSRALRHAQEPWRNCSPSGGGWVSTGWGLREASAAEAATELLRDPRRDECVGPLAFAKGPLLLVSSAAVGWIVRSDHFSRDEATSLQLATPEGLGGSVGEHPMLLLEIGARDTLEDVQLGYWLASHPTLRLVHMPWHDVWAEGLGQVRNLGRLLVAHQVPWERLAWLTRHSKRLWASALSSRRGGLRVREGYACFGAPCSRGTCAHASGQRVCALTVELARTHSAGATRGAPAAACSRGCECLATTHGGGRGAEDRFVAHEKACSFRRDRPPSYPAVCS